MNLRKLSMYIKPCVGPLSPPSFSESFSSPLELVSNICSCQFLKQQKNLYFNLINSNSRQSFNLYLDPFRMAANNNRMRLDCETLTVSARRQMALQHEQTRGEWGTVLRPHEEVYLYTKGEAPTAHDDVLPLVGPYPGRPIDTSLLIYFGDHVAPHVWAEEEHDCLKYVNHDRKIHKLYQPVYEWFQSVLWYSDLVGLCSSGYNTINHGMHGAFVER